MDKIQELLKDRILITSLWPNCNENLKIGDVITLPNDNWRYGDRDESYCQMDYFLAYPFNFRKLEWWELRSVEEMPEYLVAKKVNAPYPVYKEGEVVKVLAWLPDNTEKNDLYFVVDSLDELGHYPSGLNPATEHEYTTYITTKNK